jgi:hypothetical protein
LRKLSQNTPWTREGVGEGTGLALSAWLLKMGTKYLKRHKARAKAVKTVPKKIGRPAQQKKKQNSLNKKNR